MLDGISASLGPEASATTRATLIALAVLGSVRALRWGGVLSTRMARKALHCLIGPVFVMCWVLWPSGAASGVWAAVVPLGIVGFFALVGTGAVSDPGTVAIMARSGLARELLVGPAEYGIVCAAVTACAFRSLFALVVLSALFSGDAAAEVAGMAVQSAVARTKRRGGALALLAAPPFPGAAPRKSLAGTLAFASATFAGVVGMLGLGLRAGWPWVLALAAPHAHAPFLPLAVAGAGAMGGAVAEALTTSDHDNVTGPAGAAVAAIAASFCVGLPLLA